MKGSTFFAFMAGAALGASVALLLAPENGPTTRKKLKKKLKEHGISLNKDEISELISSILHKQVNTAKPE